MQPTPELIAELADNLRVDDWAECQEAGFHTPLTAVQFSVESSVDCRFVLVDGHVLAAFGVVMSNVLSGTGALWLLTADLVDTHRKTFVRYSKLVLGVLMKQWSTLDVNIGMNHKRGQRLASACGLRYGGLVRNKLTGAMFIEHSVGA